MVIFAECIEFLSKNAIGKWFETYRCKNPETGDDIHAMPRDGMLLRVEKNGSRAFYWIFNTRDALRFSEYVGLHLHVEAHEIILSPRCRLFYDIDFAMDNIQKQEVAEFFELELEDETERETMVAIGKRIAVIIKDATLISLEEHGVDIETDIPGFDWMFTMRNRPADNDGFKISIHVITNLMLPLKACAAVAIDVKTAAIKENKAILNIDDNLSELLCASIDDMQYRRRGSLSLPYGHKKTSKGVFVNRIFRSYDIPGQQYAITVGDQYSINHIRLNTYNWMKGEENFSGVPADRAFVKEALRHVFNIPDYSPSVWNINASSLRHSTMYVKRYAPSMCSICERTHDNDNTMFLIFNSERGVASWKCTRNPEGSPKVFYSRLTELDDDQIEAFASKVSIPKRLAWNPPSEASESTFDLDAFVSHHASTKNGNVDLDIEDPRETSARPPKSKKNNYRSKPPVRTVLQKVARPIHRIPSETSVVTTATSSSALEDEYSSDNSDDVDVVERTPLYIPRVV